MPNEFDHMYQTDAEMNSSEFSEDIIAHDSSICESCRSVFATIWTLLVISGLLGNGLIIFSIIKYNKLTNVTQCYLFHLAITDIAYIISCVPLTTYAYLYETWIFGRFVCKAYHYLSFVTVCATCLTLMMMTIDRYIYVCNTKPTQWRNSIYVFFVSCLIWIVSFILSIPNLITYDVKVQSYVKNDNLTVITEDNVECVQKKQHFLNSFIQWYSMIVSYIIPSGVLIVSYIKILAFMSSRAKRLAKLSAFNGRVSMIRKRRVTKTVIILTVTFMLLWFPVHFLATWYRLDSNFPEGFVLYVLKMVALTMAYSNASLNPIIYAFSNESVRIVLSSIFSCCQCLKVDLNPGLTTTFRFDLVTGNESGVGSGRGGGLAGGRGGRGGGGGGGGVNGRGGGNTNGGSGGSNELTVKRNRLSNGEGDFAAAEDTTGLRQIEDDLSGNLL